MVENSWDRLYTKANSVFSISTQTKGKNIKRERRANAIRVVIGIVNYLASKYEDGRINPEMEALRRELRVGNYSSVIDLAEEYFRKQEPGESFPQIVSPGSLEDRIIKSLLRR